MITAGGERTYIAIDLKSFYASVECVERGLNPLDTNLVVADKSRTDKTICLAVSPSLKAHGISGRARLFEVVQRVREVNRERMSQLPDRRLKGRATIDSVLKQNPELAVDYIVAPPRMALYIDYSTRIYKVYLKYVAPDDIHVYSIDEVFIDVTNYMRLHAMTAHRLAMTMIKDVLQTTGITATAGIGTNMYLCKVAMDIVAKHMPPDSDGVRIAGLDEMAYRRLLWSHKPLTDFWRIGPGIQRRLATYGISTMGEIARLSLRNEALLYKLFGVNAELVIDHAWGWEPCTIADVKAYRPTSSSISNGQVLTAPYTSKMALVVIMEMAESLALELLDKCLVTDQLVLYVGYDVENLSNAAIRSKYHGEIVSDHYGRAVPRHTQGTANLESATSSARTIVDATAALFDRVANHDLLIRRMSLTACHVVDERMLSTQADSVQLDLFTDYEALEQRRKAKALQMAKERKLMKAQLALKKKFGKNALLKGLDYQEGATARERNSQIGGHKA